jgi:steroid delta-isomerase-like uncharacterized protein
MSAEEHKALVRRFYDEVWNQGRLEVVDELNAPTFVERTPAPGLPPTKEGVKALVAMYRTAFPDTQFTVDDVLAEGDGVAVRWTARGTHQRELQGIPATNKQVTVTGMDLYRLDNGKIAEHWGTWDQLGLLQQLGAIPAPEQATREAGT